MNKWRVVKEFPASEPIVAMIEFNGFILVATTTHVFKMHEDETFEALKFKVPVEEVSVDHKL